MEVTKSHNLLSAKWRIRKANGVIQFKSKNLREEDTTVIVGIQWSETRNTDIHLRTRWLSQVKQEAKLPFLCHSVLLKPQ
jgi:hypothetical protein